MKRLAIVLIVTGLSGCGGGDMDDLRRFVTETGKDTQGKIDPLPEVKVYEPFSYAAFDLPDPFKPRKLSSGGGGGMQPDLSRPKEPLEAFSLETLKMVGVLSQKGVIQAVIKTPDNAIYHVKKGNYIGQNFGLVTQIGDSEVSLREIVQDSAGDWSERTSTLNLQE
ncbi:MAG: pilus assembly protein PilP [Thiobacillus sp. 63-78]|uniref:pilus assembly protein PilP n=1 Tax=Thiobacillus sp. 63-78 TaxID=1895859 RepID=UPI00086E7533|nr:pilus assembly protein PilP [Thiobacillus sp. 63-78]MBN8762448.1 pilus assembly protein PilP [Thiobacillus sp.]ODV14431.1 MAG: pilus assembly protein PilP [Thiobacillus sp. SCN 64-317]MBN8766283.1 pilus assembly protein PilP [Thiobacillus sp.]MBN8773782.1 pilus assembly protein PilP [Thiobacillus sp.]OJZ15950.1 MAG: pilus assembly protein PilP [Thiobacillus sp. 63-78]